MEKLKRKFKFFVIAALIGIFLLLVIAFTWLLYIQHRTNKQITEAMSYQFEEVNAYMSQAQKEKIALLAAKYDIYETQLESLLDEYWTKHDVGYRVRKSLYSNRSDPTGKDEEIKVNLNYSETLDDLSSRYNIPREKIASILVDYKMMTALERGNFLGDLLTVTGNGSILKYLFKGTVGQNK